MTDLNNPKERTKYWTKYAKDRLVGRKIVKVAYLTNKECEEHFGWYKRPITFTLDDGKIIIAQMDDEGNDGGVLMIEYPGETVKYDNHPGEVFQKTETIPVLSRED